MKTFIAINFYKLFYWLTVADSARAFFIFGIVVFGIMAVISTLVFIFDRENLDDSENPAKPHPGALRARKWMWYSYPFMMLFWALTIATPNRSDTLLIICGGAVGDFVTNDSSSKAIPSDITRFLHLQLQEQISNSSEEIRKQLNVQTPKEKLLDKVKDLTKEQIIDYLKKDTTSIK